MLDKADSLLSQTVGTLAMNAEAAMWVGRSAFLRRRVSGSWENAERSALSRLNSTGLMWAAAAAAGEPADALYAAVSGPRVHVAHAVAVLTGVCAVLGFRAVQCCTRSTLLLTQACCSNWTTPCR